MSEKLKVKDFPDTSSITMDNELMVLVDEENNYVNNISISDFNSNIISADEANALTQDENGKLFVEITSTENLDDLDTDDKSSLTAAINEVNGKIGNLEQLDTNDQSSMVNAINEIASTTISGAAKNLSNLTAAGNAKFQYAPFSINNGSVDSSGNNATLQTVGSSPVTLYYKRNVDEVKSPVYDNGHVTSGSIKTILPNTWTTLPIVIRIRIKTAAAFTKAVFMTTNYSPWSISINANGTMTFSSVNSSGSGVGTTSSNTLPVDSEVDILMTLNSGRNFNLKYKLASAVEYTDLFTWNAYATGAGPQFVLYADEKIVQYIDLEYTFAENEWNAIEQGSSSDYDYTKTTATSATLLCKPCTITTADNKTKSFTKDEVIDCSSLSNGSYKVLKSYTDGSLYFIKSVQVSKNGIVTEEIWTQPVLTANGTLGGNSFAVTATYEQSGHPAYQALDGDTSTFWASKSQAAFPQDYIFYNPKALRVTNINITNYSDSVIGQYEIDGSNDNSSWIKIKTGSNLTTGNLTNWDITLDTNVDYYKYYRLRSLSRLNGTNICIREIIITAYTQKITSTNTYLQVDNSQYPLKCKYYDGTNLQIDNNLVYLGDITVSGKKITSIINNEFNKYRYLLTPTPLIIQTYTSGTSGYRIWSDGYCEQWGYVAATTTNYLEQTITFLKKFSNSYYTFLCTIENSYTSGVNSKGLGYLQSSKTVSSIKICTISTNNLNSGTNWRAFGYLAAGEY